MKINKAESAQVSDRKTVERSAILAIIGLLFLMPPVAIVFDLDWLVFGIPAAVIYLFSIWALLIFGAARLSKKLQQFQVVEDQNDQPTKKPASGEHS